MSVRLPRDRLLRDIWVSAQNRKARAWFRAFLCLNYGRMLNARLQLSSDFDQRESRIFFSCHPIIGLVLTEVSMKYLSKATLALAAAATAITATPAQAGRFDRNDGIDAGDVIAGALIIGGIAAVAVAASKNRDSRYDARYDDRYDRRGEYSRGGYDYSDRRFGSRAAVDQCVRAAQRQASRFGRARVTDVTRIERVRGGYEVRGRVVVEDRGYSRGRDDWDRYGNRYDRYNDGYDKGKFSCFARYDGVADLRLSGLGNSYG